MSATIECRNPADTREVAATYPAQTPEEAASACEFASSAAADWGATPGPKRAELLYRAAVLLDERAEQVARKITLEEGKLYADALGETRRAAAVLRFHAGEAERLSGEFVDAGEPGSVAFTRRRPLGVVAAITPWNFPIAIPAWKSAPALAAGNAVVLKPASRAPGGALALAQALRDAGLPDGVMQVVLGGAAVGEALTDNPHVRALTFTGSNTVGEALRSRITQRGARFQGELGGNNPMIVLGDADLRRACSLVVNGAFGAAGQKCTATRRVIVEGDVYSEFAELLSAAARQLVVGPGLDPEVNVPPLVDSTAQREVQDAVHEAVQSGATVLAGDEEIPDAYGCYVRPTVLADARPGTSVIDEEVFGPVCALVVAADAEEAIDAANATPFGLSASVCTNDLARAFQFIRRIDAGMIHINRPTPGADPHLPFGGVKGSSASGYREQGRAAVEFFTEGQTVYIQPFVPADP